MGLVHVDATVTRFNATDGRYEAKFLVDTGATDTMVPASELVRIGITPAGTKVYELADGSRQEYRYGYAVVEVMGTTTSENVIFAPEGTEPLLGVTVLEHLGLQVDPVSSSLKRLPAVPLK